jgi:nucleoside-diphosphate-sugar epimerase
VYGPFDAWMLRQPGNIMLEIGSHSVAFLLDLVGPPDHLAVWAGNAVELPTGAPFYRRWHVSAWKGPTAVDLRFSFVPGFSEKTVHVRGSLASATVDLELDTYTLWQHTPSDMDFDRYRMVVGQGRSLRAQARRTLGRYVLSKLKLVKRGNPYGASIAAAIEAFYGSLPGPLEERVSARLGGEAIRICERIAAGAPASQPRSAAPAPVDSGPRMSPSLLILGATGFIGQEVVRRMVGAGRAVRLLARSPAKLPPDMRGPLVECIAGDVSDEGALDRALAGIDTVLHLARANVKSWPDYQRFEIDATRRIAEHALAAKVRRFVYTGTIDSFYAGAGAGVIDDATPLDPAIERRNLYARAKAHSERLLVRMRQERGLPLVIVRPGIVIGRGGSPFHWGVGMWRHGGAVCEIWGKGRNPLPLVLVEDVADALIAALDVPGIEGEAFNLIGDISLSAHEYLNEVDRCAGIRIKRHPTPIARFYLQDMIKWAVKVLVRHPERRLPMYLDWESRTQRAAFDCSGAKRRLGWRPVSERAEFIRRGIEVLAPDGRLVYSTCSLEP